MGNAAAPRQERSAQRPAPQIPAPASTTLVQPCQLSVLPGFHVQSCEFSVLSRTIMHRWTRANGPLKGNRPSTARTLLLLHQPEQALLKHRYRWREHAPDGCGVFGGPVGIRRQTTRMICRNCGKRSVLVLGSALAIEGNADRQLPHRQLLYMNPSLKRRRLRSAMRDSFMPCDRGLCLTCKAWTIFPAAASKASA